MVIFITMHGEELEYVKEHETNWMSTVGVNINEVEKLTCERLEVNMQLLYQRGLLHFI